MISRYVRTRESTNTLKSDCGYRHGQVRNHRHDLGRRGLPPAKMPSSYRPKARSRPHLRYLPGRFRGSQRLLQQPESKGGYKAAMAAAARGPVAQLDPLPTHGGPHHHPDPSWGRSVVCSPASPPPGPALSDMRARIWPRREIRGRRARPPPRAPPPAPDHRGPNHRPRRRFARPPAGLCRVRPPLTGPSPESVGRLWHRRELEQGLVLARDTPTTSRPPIRSCRGAFH